MAKKKLLIITDDSHTQEQLSRAFTDSEFRIYTEPVDMNVVFQLCFLQPDLVILEMGRSKTEGRKLLRGIRDWSFVPVIALLPPGDVWGTVEVLNAGADQCLSESYVAYELQARARALLRRTAAASATGQRAVLFPAM